MAGTSREISSAMDENHMMNTGLDSSERIKTRIHIEFT